MRRPLPLAIPAVAAALVLPGCGAQPVNPVRVLQLIPPPVAAEQGRRAPDLHRRAPDLHVRASLSAPAEQAAPPVRVPRMGSLAIGTPNHGRLLDGLQLPARGPDWIALSPPDHRWTTDRLMAFLLAVLRDYRLANPGVPPVAIGDLSLLHGGPFAGHVSHQNGLDADVYYPRLDRTPRPPLRVRDVDRLLAQDLVNRFVAFGAQFAFVGPHLGLVGPPTVVQPLRRHDNHVHVRIANVWR